MNTVSARAVVALTLVALPASARASTGSPRRPGEARPSARFGRSKEPLHKKAKHRAHGLQAKDARGIAAPAPAAAMAH